MKQQDGRTPFFSRFFLAVLLTISFATNVVLIARLRFPQIPGMLLDTFRPAPQVLPTDHVRGSATARITVIEYSDFQCPFSARFHASMTRIAAETDVRWVYRHYPLVGVHPLAFKAAEAAECAGEQGRFWEYADELFREQDSLVEGRFSVIAWTLALDQLAFDRCLSSGTYRDAVSAQRREGERRGISGTPTFFVNGRRFESDLDEDKLRLLLEKGKS